jgi:DivIVA domain-containing protein
MEPQIAGRLGKEPRARLRNTCTAMPDQSYAATEHALLEEITRPLERLPDDPLELVQAEFPTAMRGYDKAAVDDYVRETSQLVAELQAVRSPESAVRRALVRAGGQISGVLRRAHETAAEITARSRSEAEDRLERARVEADEIVSAAERRVRDLDADTDRIWLDRQRIMADVEDLSNQLLDLAKQAGAKFPDDEPGAYDQQPVEPFADVGRAGAGIEEPEYEAAPSGGSATWTPVESAERDASIGGTDDPSCSRQPPAAWERWAEHDAPAGGEAESEATALTDRAETLPLAPSERLNPSAPPEVEPRSARLSPEAGSADDRRGDAPGPADAIPPISDAANRPRRT